jgi:hypothetical protein
MIFGTRAVSDYYFPPATMILNEIASKIKMIKYHKRSMTEGGGGVSNEVA